jgi:hypothetical protein
MRRLLTCQNKIASNSALPPVMLNKHDGVTTQDRLTTEYTETTEKEGRHSVCSACSMVGFLAGNLGQYLGLFNHGIHRNHGKRRPSFLVFGVFCGWILGW